MDAERQRRGQRHEFACEDDAECKGSCICGDAQRASRYCGASCVCRYPPPGGACGDPLADGAAQPGTRDGTKACFHGQCLTQTGIDCNPDSDCGTGHCTGIDTICIRLSCPAAGYPSGPTADPRAAMDR